MLAKQRLPANNTYMRFNKMYALVKPTTIKIRSVEDSSQPHQGMFVGENG